MTTGELIRCPPFLIKMATSQEKAQQIAKRINAGVLLDAIGTASVSEEKEILDILERIENNEISDLELEKVVRSNVVARTVTL